MENSALYRLQILPAFTYHLVCSSSNHNHRITDIKVFIVSYRGGAVALNFVYVPTEKVDSLKRLVAWPSPPHHPPYTSHPTTLLKGIDPPPALFMVLHLRSLLLKLNFSSSFSSLNLIINSSHDQRLLCFVTCVCYLGIGSIDIHSYIFLYNW